MKGVRVCLPTAVVPTAGKTHTSPDIVVPPGGNRIDLFAIGSCIGLPAASHLANAATDAVSDMDCVCLLHVAEASWSVVTDSIKHRSTSTSTSALSSPPCVRLSQPQ